MLVGAGRPGVASDADQGDGYTPDACLHGKRVTPSGTAPLSGQVLSSTLGPVGPLKRVCSRGQDEAMTQPAPEYDDYEAWRDLQDVLEERDAEWWAGQDSDGEES